MKKGSNARREEFKKFEVGWDHRDKELMNALEVAFEVGWKAAKRHSTRKRKFPLTEIEKLQTRLASAESAAYERAATFIANKRDEFWEHRTIDATEFGILSEWVKEIRALIPQPTERTK